MHSVKEKVLRDSLKTVRQTIQGGYRGALWYWSERLNTTRTNGNLIAKGWGGLSGWKITKRKHLG